MREQTRPGKCFCDRCGVSPSRSTKVQIDDAYLAAARTFDLCENCAQCVLVFIEDVGMYSALENARHKKKA